MSLRSSEENYKIAKSLYQDITDDFFEIENNPDSHDDSYLIDQTLDDIKKLNRHIRRINIEDLDEGYDDRVLEIIAANVDSFKEASYFIERALISMKLFDKLHPVLEDYMKDVNWKIIADDLDKAVIKFGRFLTNEENFSQYKSMVWNIIKGTMKKKKFKEIFNLLSKRLYKPRKEVKTNKQNPLPPQMWSKEEKEKWEEQIENRKKQAVKDKKIEFDDLGERFISLEDYKKLNEYSNKEANDLINKYLYQKNPNKIKLKDRKINNDNIIKKSIGHITNFNNKEDENIYYKNIKKIEAAIDTNSLEDLKLLVNNGADIFYGHGTPLLRAIDKGSLDIIKYIANIYKEENFEDGIRQAFFKAVNMQNIDIVKILIKYGDANVNLYNDSGPGYGQPLIDSIINPNPELVQILIDAGVDIHKNLRWVDWNNIIPKKKNNQKFRMVMSILLNNGYDDFLDYL